MTISLWLFVVLCILSFPMILLLLGVVLLVIWWLAAVICEMVYQIFRGAGNGNQ